MKIIKSFILKHSSKIYFFKYYLKLVLVEYWFAEPPQAQTLDQGTDSVGWILYQQTTRDLSRTQHPKTRALIANDITKSVSYFFIFLLLSLLSPSYPEHAFLRGQKAKRIGQAMYITHVIPVTPCKYSQRVCADTPIRLCCIGALETDAMSFRTTNKACN